MSTKQIELIALPNIPLVRPGDDLKTIIIDSLKQCDLTPSDGDILVVAQKIVSKANNRFRDLREVRVSPKAEEIAETVQKDPRLVEVILSESREVVASRPGVLIVEHRLGIVMANAGVDASNVEQESDKDLVLLLPLDPDLDCEKLRRECFNQFGAKIGVIINDSVGRAWRNGTVGIALGSAGLAALLDLRGHKDLFGRELLVSQQAVADEIASAASLIQGQGSEGQPVVFVRGTKLPSLIIEDGIQALIRKKDEDLFR